MDTGTSARKTLLLVEDEAVIALSEKKSLEAFGYRVLVAGSGEEAIGKIRGGGGIDLILMDIDLGRGMDGTEAAQAILAEHDLPIVFLSSHNEPETVAKTEKITSYGYVVKSSALAVLDASIKMAFRLFDANRRIVEREERYRLLTENIKDVVWVMDAESQRFTYVSPSVTKLRGYSPEEVMHQPLSGAMDAAQVEAVRGLVLGRVGDLLSGEAPPGTYYTEEVEQPCKDGSFVWTEVITSYYLNEESGRAEILGVSRDISDRKKAEAEIERQGNLLHSVIESASGAIFAKDRAGRYRTINDAGARMLGYPKAEEVLGRTDAELISPEEAEGYRRDDLSVIASGLSVKHEEIFSIDGTPRVFLTEKKPWLDSSGLSVGVIGMSIDISERKAAEEKVQGLLEEKELLLREVHHRIKNNMSTIKSFLFLQARSLKNPAASAALRDAEFRVQSMLLLYDRLYQSENFRSISVQSYLPILIDDILENFPEEAPVAIEKDIGDFVLDAKILQPLGIILNELLTNIMKYAFEGRKDGVIRISAKLRGNLVAIAVQDNGVGLPDGVDFSDSTGFGLMLVGMLAKQLDGAIRIERGHGTRIVLEFER
jgi:PAS domain S-box-containing protein